MADETRRLIFELQINNDKLGAQLATINDRLKNAKDNQAAWNKELVGLREGTAEYTKAAKNAADFGEKVRSLQADAKATNLALKISDAVPGSYNELKSSIALTREQLNNLKIGSEDYNKTESKLNDLVSQEIQIRSTQKSLFQERITGAINESEVTKTLTQQLKALQIQLQGLEVGSDQFNKVAAEAGKLKDKINDVKDATKNMATGSNLEQFGNILGGIKNDVTNLNFQDATDKARQLAAVSKSMTFASAVESVKQLGTTLIATGRALLTNPLFLMAAAIAAVGVALYKLNQAAEDNAKAFEKAGKDLKDYASDLADIKKGATNAADALALAQGRITKADLDRKKIKDKLREDEANEEAKFQAEMQASRDEKDLTDEKKDVIQREAIRVNSEKIKNLRQTAADELKAIGIQEQIDAADRLYEGYQRTVDNEKEKTEARKEAAKTNAENQSKAYEEQKKLDEAAVKAYLDLIRNQEAEAKRLLSDKVEFSKEENERESLILAGFILDKKAAALKDFEDGIINEQQYNAQLLQLQDESGQAIRELKITQLKSSLDDVTANSIEEARIKAEIKDLEVSGHIEAEKKKVEESRRTDATERQLAQSRLSTAENIFGGIAGMLKKGSDEYKAFARLQIIASTAQGAIGAFSQASGTYPPPYGQIVGLLAAGVVAAQGVMQLQKVDALAKGGAIIPKAAKGIIIGGEPHSRGGTTFRGTDGTMFEAEKDELLTVVNKNSTDMLRGLSSLNVMGGGIDFFQGGGLKHMADGGIAARGVTDPINAQIQSQENISETVSNIKVVASIEDIIDKGNQMEIIDSRNTI